MADLPGNGDTPAVNTVKEIRKSLILLRDEKYRDFESKLFRDGIPEKMIGIRTPELKKIAKDLQPRPESEVYLKDLPHLYFEEDQLHAFIINRMKDYDTAMAAAESFLPYVDNWATCDQLDPPVFARHRAELLKSTEAWLASGRTFTIRFAMGMLMRYYLGDNFEKRFADLVCAYDNGEYYVSMMAAWYFATALALRYDDAIEYILAGRLRRETHNRAIQKAVESLRVTPEHKAYLKTLKR